MLRFFIPFSIILILIFGLISGGEVLIACLIVDFLLIVTSIRIVEPNTIRTVELFGSFNRVLRPGLNFIIPIIEQTRKQVLYRKNLGVEVEGVTKDTVTAYIGLNVIYYIVDEKNDTKDGNIYKSVYSIDDHKTMIKSTIDEQLRSMIVSFGHKEIFEKREEIGEAIEERLREKLSTFGYTLDSIQVRDVNLDQKVMTSMNKVVETQKLKEAAYNEAEAEKIMQVKQAEAEKESKVLLGQGMAGQRMEIAKGFKESVDMIKQTDESLDGNKVLQFLLDSSRIETLGNIGVKENSKIIYLNEDLEGRKSREEKLIAGSDIIK